MKISVIIVTKNSQKHIRECIESVSMQNWRDIEVFVIDARSTDKTISILSEYLSKFGDMPFEIVDVASNTTIGKARHIGVLLSNGSVLAYVDSDVELPHEKWIKNMQMPFSDMSVCGVQTLAKCKENDPKILKKIHSGFEYKNDVIDIDNYEKVGTSHILLRKSVVVEVGSFEDINYREDTRLTCRMMKAGYKFVYLPTEKCYHYHVDTYIDYLKKTIRNKKMGFEMRGH